VLEPSVEQIVPSSSRSSWLRSCKSSADSYNILQTPYFYLTAYTTLKCPQLDPNSIRPAIPLVIANYTSGIGRVSFEYTVSSFPCEADAPLVFRSWLVSLPIDSAQ
jgi:hypothetical protein